MLRAKCCYGLSAALLIVSLLVFGAFFLGKRIVNDMVADVVGKRELDVGPDVIESVSHGRVSVISSTVSDISADGDKGSFLPSINVKVEDVAAVMASNSLLELDSFLLSYELGGRRVIASVPHGSIRITRKGNGSARADALECSIGSVLVLEFQENIFISSLKRVILGSKQKNKILHAHYHDKTGAHCKNPITGERELVYDMAMFDLSALGGNGIKIGTDITKKGDSSGLFSFRIKDMELHFNPSEGHVDVNIPKFQLSSESFRTTISGVASVFDRCLVESFSGCEVNLLIEMIRYENFFQFIKNSLAAIKDVSNNTDTFRGIDAVKTATKSSSLNEEGDTLTLEIRSDGNEVRVGDRSLREFIELVFELYGEEEKAPTVQDNTVHSDNAVMN